MTEVLQLIFFVHDNDQFSILSKFHTSLNVDSGYFFNHVAISVDCSYSSFVLCQNRNRVYFFSFDFEFKQQRSFF